MALGEDGLGLEFDDAQLAQNLGTAALAVILVEGGLTTRWSDVRAVLAPAGVLATVGVGISVAVTAAGAHLLLGMDWQQALLLGAIVSSTDAAAVFAVLRTLPVPRRMAGLLEAESGFNDAPTVILMDEMAPWFRMAQAVPIGQGTLASHGEYALANLREAARKLPRCVLIGSSLAGTYGDESRALLQTFANVEGEATALYLAKLLRPLGVRITRIARGLPVGGDLEYADEVTLGRAFEGRRLLDV